jgi:hypothetical protein
MPTIVPAISVQSTAGIEIDTNVAAINYQQFLNSLGPFAYLIRLLYYNATSLPQFNAPIQYLDYDISGHLKADVVTTPISPAQFQPSMYVQIKSQLKMIFSGSNQLNFTLMAGQTVVFMAYGKRVSNGDLLPGKTNFQQVSEEFRVDMFAAYKDILEDGPLKKDMINDE